MSRAGSDSQSGNLTSARPLSEQEVMFKIKSLEERYRLARQVVRWLAIIALVWPIKDTVVAFAGRSTNVLVQAGLDIFGDFRFSITVALAGVCAVWAVVERAIRQKRVEQLHKRVKELETEIDPQRSTSKLTTKGKTNPGDRSM